MPNIVITIIIAIVMIAVVIVVTALAASNISVQNYKKNEEAKLGDAEARRKPE